MTFNFDSLDDSDSPPGKPSLGARLVQSEAKSRPRALLVGQPNVGKSVVFGALTGTYVAVSNYPGTTVEITRGSARFGDKAWQIVDTPDEARARGFSINLAAPEAQLGSVRVRTSTATEGEGLDTLREYLASCEAGDAEQRPERAPLPCAPRFPDDLEAAVEAHLPAGLQVAKRVDRLASLGILPGVELRLQQTRPVVVVECDETVLALERDVASDVVVVGCCHGGESKAAE